MKTTTHQARGLASLGSWKGQKGKIALPFVLQHVKAKRSFARPNPNLMDAQLKDNVSPKTVSFPHFMMMISVAYGSSASTVDTQKVFLPWDFLTVLPTLATFWQLDLLIPWDKRATLVDDTVSFHENARSYVKWQNRLGFQKCALIFFSFKMINSFLDSLQLTALKNKLDDGGSPWKWNYKYLNIQEIHLNELHKYLNLMRQMAYYN